MSPYVLGSLTARVTTICLLGFALSACQKGAIPTADEGSEITWARSALERNPQLELLAVDAQSGVFTVRNKATSEVLAVKLNEIAAAPIAQLKVPTPAPPAAPAAPQAPAEPVASAPPTPAASAAQPTAPSPPTQPSSTATAAKAGATTPGYTVERNAGQVRVSGPGVSIVSAGPANTANARSGAGARAAEPIICEGKRMLHLDDREIYVDGDAITARSGCELYITNSRIIASGTGIVVRDATVHVSNSHIEGANGSFDADDRAKVFVRSSTFHGIPKRTDLAMVQDQGGNRWQ